jgi:hypothetical protein
MPVGLASFCRQMRQFKLFQAGYQITQQRVPIGLRGVTDDWD